MMGAFCTKGNVMEDTIRVLILVSLILQLIIAILDLIR